MSSVAILLPPSPNSPIPNLSLKLDSLRSGGRGWQDTMTLGTVELDPSELLIKDFSGVKARSSVRVRRE